MKRTGMGIVLMLIVLSALGGAADAERGGKAKTKLSMKMHCDDGTCQRAKALTTGSFDGKVRSKEDSCVAGREVKVIRKGVSPGPIGSVEADSNGKWELEDDGLLPGKYFAKTGKAPGCKTGKSKKWTLAFERKRAGNPERFETALKIDHTCSGQPCRAAPRRLSIAIEFFGEVKSKSTACEAGRHIRIVDTDFNMVVGKTETASDGSWEVDVDGQNDRTYVAKVHRVKHPDFICKRTEKQQHVML